MCILELANVAIPGMCPILTCGIDALYDVPGIIKHYCKYYHTSDVPGPDIAGSNLSGNIF